MSTEAISPYLQEIDHARNVLRPVGDSKSGTAASRGWVMNSERYLEDFVVVEAKSVTDPSRN